MKILRTGTINFCWHVIQPDRKQKTRWQKCRKPTKKADAAFGFPKQKREVIFLMDVKFAADIARDIEERGPVTVPDGCVTGEAYETWLCEETTEQIEQNKGETKS